VHTRPPLPVRILAVLLVVWVPVSLALEASAGLPRLVAYGWPAMVLLTVRAFVAGLAVVAGRALWSVEPHGPRLARAWLVLDAIVMGVTLATPYFPSNRLPGTRVWAWAGVAAINGMWLVYLGASRRVRACWSARDRHAFGGGDGLL
jgi:hypothetical protein